MKKIIDYLNKNRKIKLDYPKTDLEILKAYKILLSCFSDDEEGMSMLENVKLPEIDSYQDYFCIHKDGNEYYTVDLSADPSSWDVDEIEKAIRKGKVILAKDNEGNLYNVQSVEINLLSHPKGIRLQTIDDSYCYPDLDN